MVVADLKGRFRGLGDPETGHGIPQQREPSDAGNPRKECGGHNPPQIGSLQRGWFAIIGWRQLEFTSEELSLHTVTIYPASYVQRK